jgi:phage baseplate assembly protein W
METNEFIGTGWQWPIGTDPTGSIAMASGVAELEQSIFLILSTSPGERPMRPEFGSRLADFIFASADATTAGLIAHEVRRALTRWEPRIAVEDVSVTISADDPATLLIEISYRVLHTYDRRNLVFPFYLIPEHEPEGLLEHD